MVSNYSPIAVDEMKRRRKLAEALLAQSQDSSPVQHWTQGLARIAQAYAGSQLSKEADTREQQLATDEQRKTADALLNYDKQARGAPAQAPLTPNDDQGFPMPGLPATPPDPRAANMSLVNSGIPALQQFGAQAMLKGDAPEEFGTEPRYDQQGRAYVVGKRGGMKYLDNITEPPKDMVVGSSVVRKQGGQYSPVFTGAPAQLQEFDALLQRSGIDPKGEVAQGLYRSFAQKMATHQPGTTVNVDTAKKPMATAIGEGIGKDFEAARQTAIGAQKSNQVADEAEKLLNSGAITGAGAALKMQGGKILQAVGLKGAVDPQLIANTEGLISNLAQQTLANIRQSGLGGGNGFSNADREFLQKATGGSIDMTELGLRKLVELNRRSNANILQSFDSMATELEKRPEYRDVPLRLGVGGGRQDAASRTEIDLLVRKYGRR